MQRINFTHRRRIRRADVDIHLDADDDGVWVTASADVANYTLPDDSRLCLEAYRQTTWTRVECGSVAEPEWPSRHPLADFASPEGILFRLKVYLDEDGLRRLVGVADRIRPRTPDESETPKLSLLPVVPQDLADEVWRLDFDDGPKLIVSTRAGDVHAVARSREFRSLVLPAVLREVLAQILLADRYTDLDDTDDWRTLWLRFAATLPGVPNVEDAGRPENDPDLVREWIGNAVTQFSRRMQSLPNFTAFWQETN